MTIKCRFLDKSLEHYLTTLENTPSLHSIIYSPKS